MKICLVHYEYPEETNIGGISTYQRRMAMALKDRGHQVTVIAGSLEAEQDYMDDGVHVIRIKKGSQYDTIEHCIDYREKVSQKLQELVRKKEVEVVEIPEMGAEGVIYQENREIPIVVKLHTPFSIWAEFNKTTLEKNLHKQLEDWEETFIKNADKVISCTELLKGMLEERMNIAYKNIEVVPNPANITSFYPTTNNHNSKIILYCGGLEQRKGADMFGRAIPIILDELKDEEIEFHFIGYDTDRNEKNILMSDYIRELVPEKYHKQLHFLGHLPNSSLNEHYNEARIAVLPSLFDNLPYVAMEELLTELPLVASNNTGVREMIENGKSGLLYDPKDPTMLAQHIIYLYKNEDKAKEFGKLARKTILEKYSPEVIAKIMEKVYQEAIDEFQRNR